MEKKKINFLQDLCNCSSPSGFETEALKIWKDYLKTHGFKVESDAYGNSVAYIGPEGAPTVGVVGHADEIGQMVVHINDKGFLNITGIGGWDTRVLLGRKVNVLTVKGTIPGVIGSTAIHLLGRDSDKKAPSWEDLYVDIGASNKKDAEKKVRIGDPVVISGHFTFLTKDIVTTKALDNKIGIWSSAETLVRLKKFSKKLKVRVAGFCSVQEEVGIVGASMIARNFRPDIAIAVDVTHSTDHPGVDIRKHGLCKMGSGLALSRGSANHPKLLQDLANVAEKKKIPVQYDISANRSGTDADALYRAGVPTVAMSLPIRYMHTPVETAHLDDLDSIPELIAHYALSLPGNIDYSVKL